MRPKLIFSIALILLTLILISASITSTVPQTNAFGSTPSTTPVPNFQLLDWVSDPTVNVFIVETYTEEDTYPTRHTLINVDTGERFYIDLSYVDGATWYMIQDQLFLRLHRNRSSGADNSDGFVEFVDISTQQLTRYTLDDPARPARQGVLPAESTANENGFSYRDEGETVVLILPDSTEIPLENPYIEQGYNDSRVTWHRDFLHVRYGSYVDMFTYVSEDVIYNTEGEILMSFEDASPPIWANNNELRILYRSDDAGICLFDLDTMQRACNLLTSWETENETQVINATWSPDNNEFLFFYRIPDTPTGGLCRFTLNTSDANCVWKHTIEYGTFTGGIRAWLDDSTVVFAYLNSVSYFDTRTPRDTGLCVLDFNTNETYCPTDDLLPPDTYYSFNIVSHSLTKTAIVYTGQDYAGQDGLCIHDFETRQTHCPVSTDDLMGQYIEEVGWSPDERHIVVMYGPYGPLSDDKSFTRFGFVDVANDTYRDEGYAYLEHNLIPLWRP